MTALADFTDMADLLCCCSYFVVVVVVVVGRRKEEMIVVGVIDFTDLEDLS